MQIPHTPFVMDSECNYIEYKVGDRNNSKDVINGQIECAKKLIKIISEQFNSPNTLLIIHGDHSLNEVVLKVSKPSKIFTIFLALLSSRS